MEVLLFLISVQNNVKHVMDKLLIINVNEIKLIRMILFILYFVIFIISYFLRELIGYFRELVIILKILLFLHFNEIK